MTTFCQCWQWTETSNLGHDISVVVILTSNLGQDISVVVILTCNLGQDIRVVIILTSNLGQDIRVVVILTSNLGQDISVVVILTSNLGQGWDLRPGGGQPFGSSLSKRLSSICKFGEHCWYAYKMAANLPTIRKRLTCKWRLGYFPSL